MIATKNTKEYLVAKNGFHSFKADGAPFNLGTGKRSWFSISLQDCFGVFEFCADVCSCITRGTRKVVSRTRLFRFCIDRRSCPRAAIAANVTMALIEAMPGLPRILISSNATLTVSLPSDANQPSIATRQAAAPAYDHFPYASNILTSKAYNSIIASTFFVRTADL